jgi:hypothetical protein
MFFEKVILKNIKKKEELIKKYPIFEFNCGEKVIWEKRVMGKTGRSTETIIDYCLKWNSIFGDESKIIQIVRHPLDSLNSLVLSKKRLPRGPTFEVVYEEYLEYVVQFVNGIKSIENCLTIQYENLILKPKEIIKKLYQHCNIDDKFLPNIKMRENRIFNYETKNLLFNYDKRLNNIILQLSNIDGVEYKLKTKETQ